MLNDIFKFLSPSKNVKSSNRSKHLVIKTEYCSLHPISQELLCKQKEILLLNPSYQDATIILTSLNKEDVLIGLTKHQNTVLGGVFMFPELVRETVTWEEIENQAGQQQTGVAIFKPSRPVHCLKITPSKPTESIRYLVDHRTISLVERLPLNMCYSSITKRL